LSVGAYFKAKKRPLISIGILKDLRVLPIFKKPFKLDRTLVLEQNKLTLRSIEGAIHSKMLFSDG